MSINISKNIFLKVITPIHVGGAQDKNLQEGLDYYETRLVKMSELFNPANGFNPDELAVALESGTKDALKKLIEVKKLKTKVTTELIGQKGSTGEIKAFIKDGAYGKPYIPGSSIKGAIRNAVAHFLYETNGRNKGTKTDPDKFYNETFEKSIFRFIKIYDGHFEKIQLFRSKIMSLGQSGSTWIPKWKKGRFQNEITFSQAGFDTAFESPAVGSVINFDIQIAEPLLNVSQFANEFKTTNAESKKIIQTNSFSNLFVAINKSTEDHLKRELKFFEKYKAGDKLIHVVNRIKTLLTLIDNSDSPTKALLRMGSGSGFHSLSGDWQFEDHDNTGLRNELNKKTGVVSQIKKYKTRRIAFNDNATEFYLMGFVLLSLEPIHSNVFTSVVSSIQTIIPAKEIIAEFLNVKIKQGNQLEAVVKESARPFSKVELYMPDKTTIVVEMANGTADVGKVIIVRINNVDKTGNVKQVSFVGLKK